MRISMRSFSFHVFRSAFPLQRTAPLCFRFVVPHVSFRSPVDHCSSFRLIGFPSRLFKLVLQLNRPQLLDSQSLRYSVPDKFIENKYGTMSGHTHSAKALMHPTVGFVGKSSAPARRSGFRKVNPDRRNPEPSRARFPGMVQSVLGVVRTICEAASQTVASSYRST